MKMVIIVRQDLKMGKGKIAAQVGHAVARLVHTCIEEKDVDPTQWQWYSRWIEDLERKVVLKVPDWPALRGIIKALDGEAVQMLNWEAVIDAGLTQIDPGQTTCVGIGPAPDGMIDVYTEGLKLL